jgi:hypothetical protein
LKHLIPFTAAMVALLLAGTAQAGDVGRASDNAVLEKIQALEEERNQAILRGDVATLDRMTSDDYTFVTIRGELRTKAQILNDFRSGSIKYQSRTISDLHIRVYGNSAVVTGRAIQQGMENGKDYSGDYWFTRVYVNQHGQWRTVALQTTLIQR